MILSLDLKPEPWLDLDLDLDLKPEIGGALIAIVVTSPDEKHALADAGKWSSRLFFQGCLPRMSRGSSLMVSIGGKLKEKGPMIHERKLESCRPRSAYSLSILLRPGALLRLYTIGDGLSSSAQTRQ